MVEYIYFVKCPNCEDEHFYFFNDAKECAMSQLSKKPIITQTEVNRNDFGECTDSCDLGTVWSWEDMMKDVPADQEQTTFSKADTVKCDNCFDQEFDELDNSLEPDRKPVPAGMTVEQLVEEMEDNEDDVECKSCHDLFDKSECAYDKDYHGYLCSACQRAVVDHGGDLNIGEAPLEEAIDPRDLVELEYPSLTVTLYSSKRDVDDWDEVEHTDSHVFLVPKVEVATAIWENWITEEDVKDVEGGLDALEDDNAWEAFLETHFDTLFEKYNKQILDHFEDEATEDFRERSQEEYEMDKLSSDTDRAYDEWRDARYFGESKEKPFLEELEDPDTYRERLTACPECGSEQAFDHETGFCINCGFNI
jgi:hypothetical protein